MDPAKSNPYNCTFQTPLEARFKLFDRQPCLSATLEIIATRHVRIDGQLDHETFHDLPNFSLHLPIDSRMRRIYLAMSGTAGDGHREEVATGTNFKKHQWTQ